MRATDKRTRQEKASAGAKCYLYQGERKRGRLVFSPEEVLDMRRRWWQDEATLRQLAREFGVSHVQVWRIVNGKSYRGVEEERERAERR